MSDQDQDLEICVKCSRRLGTKLWRGVPVCPDCLATLERVQQRGIARNGLRQYNLYISVGSLLAIVLLSMVWLLLGWAPAALLTLGVTGVALILWRAKQYE